MPILSCGGDKQNFAVVLAVKVSGENLPLKVTFKGVRQLRSQVPPRMQVSVHQKRWMDEEVTIEWIRKNLPSTPEHQAILVWDSFRGHLTDAVKDLLCRGNFDVAVFPGGLKKKRVIKIKEKKKTYP